ncbi:hypothetical protein I6A84_13570 [Frankia sp. CNm7]|uniref:Uncharacterized protein n=2 Tax=Frankia nepalensis TaxID=1836974 RepID=A0A937RGU8_9ACTN|nr:hypothetical protein [Frankia nepalensis]MBL7513434.1 hypothetical protein [Frankia nepalensis]MBL7519107.1 hypothetical protein [Frankia nepalensis]MBL7626123.1 hypothetical protein [Frankia nepalensis]
MGCDAVDSTSEPGDRTTPATTTAPGTPAPRPAGPFALPASACDLVEAGTVERVADRTSVGLTPLGGSPTGRIHTVLTCAFTDGVLPVGLLTVDVRDATAGRSAAEELDESLAGGLYRTDDAQDVPGLGDAARYGTALDVAGLTYATVWVVALGDGQVGDLTVTVASRAPEAARDGVIGIARAALTELDRQDTTAG